MQVSDIWRKTAAVIHPPKINWTTKFNCLDHLYSYFLASGVPANDIETITNAFSFTKIPKGHFFAEEGKTSKYLAFSRSLKADSLKMSSVSTDSEILP